MAHGLVLDIGGREEARWEEEGGKHTHGCPPVSEGLQQHSPDFSTLFACFLNKVSSYVSS